MVDRDNLPRMTTELAVILAAGVGSRLRPLTDDRPKALVEVGGESILGRAIRLLGAHGVSMQFDGDASETSLPVQVLAAPDPSLPPPRLFAHEARGLGVVVISVAQVAPDRRVRLLAQAWPLDQVGFDVGIPALAARYGASAGLERLGGIELDADAGDLAVNLPGPALH